MNVGEYVKRIMSDLQLDPDIKPEDVMAIGTKLVSEGFALVISKNMEAGAYGG